MTAAQDWEKQVNAALADWERDIGSDIRRIKMPRDWWTAGYQYGVADGEIRAHDAIKAKLADPVGVLQDILSELEDHP